MVVVSAWLYRNIREKLGTLLGKEERAMRARSLSPSPGEGSEAPSHAGKVFTRACQILTLAHSRVT